MLESLLKWNGFVKFVFFWLKAHLPLWILKQFLRVYVGESWVELSADMSRDESWLTISSFLPEYTQKPYFKFSSIHPLPPPTPCTAELDRGSVMWDTQNERVWKTTSNLQAGNEVLSFFLRHTIYIGFRVFPEKRAEVSDTHNETGTSSVAKSKSHGDRAAKIK